jgi:four helix bundle protein
VHSGLLQRVERLAAGRGALLRKCSRFHRGKLRAPHPGMGEPVRKHQDLIAWQLCSQFRRLVLRYTKTGAVSKDYDYRRQLRRAARSACYNTSEGFYRYKHGEFGHQLNVARASLGEALDQIDEGVEVDYFTKTQHTEMKRICLRAMKANMALRASWGNNEAP